MRTVKHIIFLFALLCVKISFAQKDFLCICFDEKTEFLNTSINQETGETSFSIVKLGYETEEQRQVAYDRYRRKPIDYPVFTVDYLSLGKYDEKESLASVPCMLKMTVAEFRNRRGKYPDGVTFNGILFIKHMIPERFLIWEVLSVPQ